ncbi:class I SAM-dependent DNA methyltransferase [Streptomyces sedi]|uniref:Class I SAM-dependent methyltransferase n=1 Tax=Streptomyces sedi TaxID=555059 RepID=A0A5C4VE40_9ACTN|nr:class I SAM-dependent methyltransferase [Streptomyces sedi]TNM34204.1 class I SAM-dependent methyltransferase [Streptomyces sedi]
MYDTQFAEVYDRVYCTLYDYAAHARLIADLAREHAPEAATLLDVGCGTGEHLRHLRGEFAVTGLDLSEPMLARAREKLPADVPLHQADMRKFDLGRSYDVICSMYSAVGYLGGVPDLRDAVATMARHLTPAGVLIVEPWILRERWRGGQLAHASVERDGVTISRMGQWRTEGDRSAVDMHYLVSEPGGEGVRHFVDREDLALFSGDAYEEAFTAAGLTPRLLPVGRGDRGVYVATRTAGTA